MKGQVVWWSVLAVMVSSTAIAQSEHSVDVQKLTVNSTNVIDGEVRAVDGSTVSVGDTRMSNVKAGAVEIDTYNETGGITAERNGVVSVGDVKLNNVDTGGSKIDIDATNIVDGEITATDDSTVTVGSTSLSNIKSSGKVEVGTYNEVKGGITAEDNSHVRIGTTSTK